MAVRSQALAAALDPARGPGRLLRASLAVLALVVSIKLSVDSFLIPIWGVDVVVPLRAAARWLDGGQPYLASSFQAGSGYDVPYLYPPLFLPLFAPLTGLPPGLVVIAGNVACMLAGYAACRRLGVPPGWIPLLFLWPPFSGGISGANLELPIFAAFVFLYWEPARRAWQPRARDFSGLRRSPGLARDGFLAALVPAIKISQGHAWVGLLRLRPRAAVAAVVLAGCAAAVVLPLTGIGPWIDWVAQLGRAADPAWALRGAGLTSGAPAFVTTGLALATMAAALFVPRTSAGAWIGLLTVIGAPGLRHYALVFAFPAMLELRREVALVAGLLIASYTLEGLWAGIAIVVAAYLAAIRYPALRESNIG